MNSNTFRMPAGRTAAALAAAALAALPVAAAAPAHATGGGEGRATAVVLRAGLDVSLLDKTVQVPLETTLNAVQAPDSAEKTALSVELDGVEKGRPVRLLRADVATSRATVEGGRAEAYSNLADARVHVPGLPLLSLIQVQEATSKAVCEAGKQPVAESNVLGTVKVLGKKVTLRAGGPTRVQVPGVGEVSLELSKTHTTSRTAAATALRLDIAVDPLKLNVAEVNGGITLVEATCESPDAPRTPEKPAEPAPPAEDGPAHEPADDKPARDVSAQSGAEPTEENLAETGGSSTTPYLAGGAAVLLAAGAAATLLARRRSKG
ncbi:SCO1860 family LAETG-anchored protein [Streptomyces peucetius]|uniref:LPXTG cell wall anchor domain-containing protein n=1 Tax=Streptomyces peucetius TaxID=1950 RepID=A0ABY6I5C8_STRPE|nr:SCO1860 family LAETG-anchored protein [Streptomyces peucetius]UYQ61440.1 LPXTG cell wall anchor domain-containing protein [Streptomyces peucetius]